MKLKAFVETYLPDAVELKDIFSSKCYGRLFQRIVVDKNFDSASLRKLLKEYADSKEGPFGKRRLALYQQAGELFNQLRIQIPLPELKPYELKDSFLGGEEADLIMLTCSHEQMAQEAIAQQVLSCSTNTIATRRSKLKSGIRIAGMCFQADFGYRGQFRSTAHPISLPLNLSEVYVLLKALKEYEDECGYSNPHSAIAHRLSNMIYGELSDYAKGKLSDRFKQAGYHLEPESPIFEEDCTAASNWVFFEKSGSNAQVELADGTTLVGQIQPATKRTTRNTLVVRTADGEAKAPWSEVIAIDSYEGPVS